MKRISILIDFANRLPELYLKATLDEKRLILNTIIESITYNEDDNTLSVKLRPVFEHLRQLKLKRKQEFKEDLETLTGTLKTRSGSAKQALENNRLDLSNIAVIGTRKKGLNTKIEPIHKGSKKLNVDGGTCLGFAPRSASFAFEPAVQFRSISSLSGLVSLSCSPALNGSATPPPTRRRFALCWLALRPSANPLNPQFTD